MSILAGELVTAADQTIARYLSQASSDLALTSTITDVPGTSVAVTAQTSGAFYIAVAQIRLGRTSSNSGAIAFSRINLDGSSVSAAPTSYAFTATTGGTLASSGTWNQVVTHTGTLSAGSHTFKLTGSCATSGVWTIQTSDTNLAILVFQ